MRSWSLVKTPITFVGIVGDEAGATCLRLLAGPQRAAEAHLCREFPDARREPGFLPIVEEELRAYFSGAPVTFSTPYRFERLTSFQQEVLEACGRIPYGKTMSYASLASWIGRPRAARAVGGALGRNPLPLLIPCHRVVAENNRLGGFSAQAGVGLKRKLLALEGVEI